MQEFDNIDDDEDRLSDPAVGPSFREKLVAGIIRAHPGEAKRVENDVEQRLRLAMRALFGRRFYRDTKASDDHSALFRMAELWLEERV